jgi:hypothetical protein
MTTHPLDETAWRLVAYRSGDQLVDTPPDGMVTLRFDLPGVGGRSAINLYHGTVEFKPDATEDAAERELTLTGFASTMMAGPEPLMALEFRSSSCKQRRVGRWRMSASRCRMLEAHPHSALSRTPAVDCSCCDVVVTPAA